MNRHLKIGIFVLTLVAFWSMTASAAEMSIFSSHTLNVTVKKYDLTGGGAALTPYDGYTISYAAGYAYDPYNDAYAEDYKYGTPSGTTSVNPSAIPTTDWLKQQNASMTWSDSQNVATSHQAIGWAPNSSAPNAYDGYIEQYVYNYSYMYFEVPEDGYYLGLAAGNYTNDVSLQQAAGSANTFHELYGYSYFWSEFDYSSGYSTSNKQPFYLNEYNGSYPIPDFAQSVSEEVGVGMLAYLYQGDVITFYTEDKSYYYGYSNTAPLPSTLLLLSGGLAGLLVLNRRRVN